jgi:hypothetical protein
MTLYDMVFKKDPRARVFLDIFDGGHEIDMKMAMYWLLSRYKGDEKVSITG